MYTKTLINKGGLSVVVTEQAGTATLALQVQKSAGGGDVAGFLNVAGSISVNLNAKTIVDAGLELAALKFPSVAALIKEAQALIDAEIAAN